MIQVSLAPTISKVKSPWLESFFISIIMRTFFNLLCVHHLMFTFNWHTMSANLSFPPITYTWNIQHHHEDNHEECYTYEIITIKWFLKRNERKKFIERREKSTSHEWITWELLWKTWLLHSKGTTSESSSSASEWKSVLKDLLSLSFSINWMKK